LFSSKTLLLGNASSLTQYIQVRLNSSLPLEYAPVSSFLW
jgi:hypothetical protein